MVTWSGWQLLGRHSQVPDWARLTRSRLTELQLFQSVRLEVSSQPGDLRGGSGWPLKYQNMWSGGWGETTVQLMVCEDPTLR